MLIVLLKIPVVPADFLVLAVKHDAGCALFALALFGFQSVDVVVHVMVATPVVVPVAAVAELVAFDADVLVVSHSAAAAAAAAAVVVAAASDVETIAAVVKGSMVC